MYVVHGTAKLLSRLKAAPVAGPPASTTTLGAWYATVLAWRSPVALFVNESTLVPVLLKLAPSRTLCERFPSELARVLGDLGTPPSFIEAERAQMDEYVLAKTANRSTVGMLNEFGFLADAHRGQSDPDDLTELSVALAATPCGPLYRTHTVPYRALQALTGSPHTPHPRHVR